MAEFVFKDVIKKAGKSDDFVVCSRATSYEEEGNPVYPPAREVLARHGISCAGKYAQRLQKTDYDDFDMLICMEERNVQNTLRIIGSDPKHKLCLLLDYTDKKGDIADPYYTGDFDLTFRQIQAGCEGLNLYLTR